MIDSKYALKYPMPHSIVHIVDNSGVNAISTVDVANDPSLLSTLVVTGAPMGEDNKIIPLTRSDVVEAAFGMGALTPADVKKYGQSVTYALDLIRQGVPVQFMRVTPPDAEYAVVSLVAEYMIDNTDGCLHVRFVKKTWPDTGLPRDSFKNTSRLNDALIKAYKNDSVDKTIDGWSRVCLVNFIAAGRGAIYNNMSATINLVTQSKRPTNVKYEFSTIDNRTGAVVEQFYASLVNNIVGNSIVTNTTESVNTLVASRLPGSSIIIPYLNEDAVQKIYNIYMSYFKEKIDAGEVTPEERAVYNTLNINTFDLIFGKYIYNGTSTDDQLPFYTVEMETSDLPKLGAENTISVLKSNWTKEPTVLQNKLISMTKGVSEGDSEVFVGDLFVTRSSTGGSANPKISVITAVNQYTGLVTSLTIPKLYTLKKSDHKTLEKVYLEGDTAPRSISFIVSDVVETKSSEGEVTGYTSNSVDKFIKNSQLKNNDIIVNTKSSNNFDLFCVEFVTEDGVVKGYKLHKYDDGILYDALYRDSHAGKTVGTGNAFGFDSDCAAWNKVGCAVVIPDSDTSSLPQIAINTYKRTAADDANDADNQPAYMVNRVLVNRTTGKRVGAVPSDIKHSNISGTSYDVKVYDASNIEKWKVTGIDLVTAGTGYEVGDRLYLSINASDRPTESDNSNVKTIIQVTSVDDDGAIRTFKFIRSVAYDNTDAPIASLLEDEITFNFEFLPDSDGATRPNVSHGSFKVTSFDVTEGEATEIRRYTVSGTAYSLYSILPTYEVVPKGYYNGEQGINPSSTDNSLKLEGGNAGFFDSTDISDIEYKWKYSALLVQALRGGNGFDRRILSPTRVPAKFMFDGGFNTIVGSVLSSNISSYTPQQLINASIIFTEDEKSSVEIYPENLGSIGTAADIDVKQAMYDLMIQRCYDGIPEDKRPIGPGSGFQVYFDSGVTDAETTTLVRDSFLKRFDNPNAIWDIGGFVEASTGISYTFVKHIAEDLFRHINAVGINKPYAGRTTAIPKNRFVEFFPDLDTTDWGQRETLYSSGGNAWILGRDGNLERKSQVTLKRDSVTSDLLQENNMRTLSRLVYLLQDKIDSYLLNYNSDSVLSSLSDEVNNMFSNWTGSYVDALSIQFERDKNIDGADILVCYVNVTFRGLILRVPIIVNVNARQ